MDQNSPKPGQEPSGVPAAAPAKVVDRRTLLRAGAASAPVLLTFASRPVSAGTSGCVVASSFLSVATFKSRNPNVTMNCTSQTLTFWTNKAKTGYVLTGTGTVGKCTGTDAYSVALNVTVATALGATGSPYDGQNLCAVFQTAASSGMQGVLQRIICLYLNVSMGNIISPPAFNVTYLRSMWSYYKTNNNYKVSNTGIVWTEAGLLQYLNAMLGVPF